MSDTPEAPPTPETPDPAPAPQAETPVPPPTEAAAPEVPAAPAPEATAVPAPETPAAPAPETPAAPAPETSVTDPPATAAPAAAAVATAPAPVPASPVAAVPAKTRRSVQVPVWLLVVLTIVVVGVGAFVVGRETAPDSGDSGPKTLAEAVEQTAAGDMEVGDFDVRTLLQALSQNRDLDLGALGDLILGQGGRN